jgi:hypothetical protein
MSTSFSSVDAPSRQPQEGDSQCPIDAHTSRNPGQEGSGSVSAERPAIPLPQASSCHLARTPATTLTIHGKEGVDGSSPSEGFVLPLLSETDADSTRTHISESSRQALPHPGLNGNRPQAGPVSAHHEDSTDREE